MVNGDSQSYLLGLHPQSMIPWQLLKCSPPTRLSDTSSTCCLCVWIGTFGPEVAQIPSNSIFISDLRICGMVKSPQLWILSRVSNLLSSLLIKSRENRYLSESIHIRSLHPDELQDRKILTRRTSETGGSGWQGISALKRGRPSILWKEDGCCVGSNE